MQNFIPTYSKNDTQDDILIQNLFYEKNHMRKLILHYKK